MDHLIDNADRELELPPEGHPLHKLGARLTELLDEDQWAECERLLLEGWELDAADRATGARWRANSSLEEWFPYTHEELARLRDLCDDLYSVQETIKLRRDRWAR